MARSRFILVIVALTALGVIAGCSRGKPRLQPYKETRQLMGIEVAVSVYPPEGVSGRDAADKAFAAIERVDREMSDYRTDSEVSKISANAGGAPVPVSAEVRNVIVRAAYFSRLSGGAFDVTIRPLVKLWQTAGVDNKLPSEEAIAKAKALVDWRQISVLNWTETEPSDSIKLGKAGMELELGGIGKGFAADAAIAALREAGVKSALVAAAGDMYALGSHPDGSPWLVGIQSPDSEGESLPQTLSLTDMAVSTSGDYRRYVEIEGRRYSHIIDPHTGRPVARMASVTVVAPNATDADALATALSVLGPDKGMELVRELRNVQAMMIVRQDSGPPSVVMSDGFKAFITPESK